MDEYIEVWVSGDGGSWSCSSSVLYRIPTEIFDYCMMIGSLNSKEDLDYLVDKIAKENESNNSKSLIEYTDIWVSSNETWSGLPPVCYKIPLDVFNYLTSSENGQKRIGNLNNQEELDYIIKEVREKGGISFTYSGYNISMKEIKTCGHTCTKSSYKDNCCACADLRPVRDDNKYPSYVDGKGWENTSSRGSGYCPLCKY